MIYAMIAKYIKDDWEAVGTIELGPRGFTYETKDPRLASLLDGIRRKGIWTLVAGGLGTDGVRWDNWEYVKLTEKTSGGLSDALEEGGFVYWGEED